MGCSFFFIKVNLDLKNDHSKQLFDSLGNFFQHFGNFSTVWQFFYSLATFFKVFGTIFISFGNFSFSNSLGDFFQQWVVWVAFLATFSKFLGNFWTVLECF